MVGTDWRISDWLEVQDHGLYCRPADLWIDPASARARAVISHGHADHARAGHDAVLATPETIAIMRTRYGTEAAKRFQPLVYGESIDMGGVRLTLYPAGHVLGSAQILLEYRGCRLVVSGDYKTRSDPTCTAYEPVRADVFVTEATFGLPVFTHPAIEQELDKVFASLQRHPDRAHVIGAYALGKCQRLIAELRRRGYDKPIYLHGAQKALCSLYRAHGIDLGQLEDATVANAKTKFAGEIVLAPPSATRDRWARRMADPVVAMASGWMGVRQRAKQRLVELPLIVSDHADWPELTDAITATGCEEVWVTHGREEALVHWAQGRGLKARALSLLGREEEES
ncbi:MAG: ligase-associated DNA damage response exonuclease [Rhodothalassiaceae bacterium]